MPVARLDKKVKPGGTGTWQRVLCGRENERGEYDCGGLLGFVFEGGGIDEDGSRYRLFMRGTGWEKRAEDNVMKLTKHARVRVETQTRKAGKDGSTIWIKDRAPYVSEEDRAVGVEPDYSLIQPAFLHPMKCPNPGCGQVNILDPERLRLRHPMYRKQTP